MSTSSSTAHNGVGSYAGLTPQQLSAAQATGPVLVLAGAGTGKTKTLTAAILHRIQVRKIAPSRILAVTFTNKAAGEMTLRIRANLGTDAAPYWIGTFHGLTARQLRIEPEVAGLRPGFDILDADDSRRIVKRILKATDLTTDVDAGPIGRDPLKVICARLSHFKDSLITPELAPAYIESTIGATQNGDRRLDIDLLRLSGQIYVDYQRILRESNAADFGDLRNVSTTLMH